MIRQILILLAACLVLFASETHAQRDSTGYEALKTKANNYFAASEYSNVLTLKQQLLTHSQGYDTLRAEALYFMAGAYKRIYQSDSSMHYYQLALDHMKDCELTHHTYYVRCLDGKAFLYFRARKFYLAEPLYLQCIEFYKNSKQTSHHRYTSAHYFLSVIYNSLGLEERSFYYARQAKELAAFHFGKESQLYITSLNMLGNLHYQADSVDKAEEILLQTTTYYHNKFGPTHQRYALIILNLSRNYIKSGQAHKALKIAHECKNIYEANEQKHSIGYPRVLKTLGDIYMLRAKQSGEDSITHYMNLAEHYYTEAVEFAKRNHRINDDSYLNMQADLARFYYQNQQQEQAMEILAQTFALSQDERRRYFAIFSEKEKAMFRDSDKKRRDLFASLVLNNSKIHSERSSILYDYELFDKGVVLRSMSTLLAQSSRSQDSTVQQLYTSYQLMKESISRLHMYAHRNNRYRLDSLEQELTRLEKELCYHFPAFSREVQEISLSHKDLASHLKPDEAAVEIIRFRYYTPEGNTDSTYYCALVLKADQSPVQMHYLCSEQRLRKALKRAPLNSTSLPSEVYSHTLYQLVWGPLNSALKDIHKVYYSPAGLLHSVALHALPDQHGTYLSDKWDIHLVSSTANIVLNNAPYTLSAGQTTCIFGGIDYGTSTNTLNAWAPLENTLRETDRISTILSAENAQIEVYKGRQASEEKLKEMGTESKASPHILHLATHGFYYPDRGQIMALKDEKETDYSRLFRGSGDYVKTAIRHADDPMIRSGLILADGNQSWTSNTDAIEGEDGILTAYEVTDLKLYNTRLVVLSGCNSGLGDIVGNEGVYGLRRAFKMAGADYLISSLWEVPDKQTEELMTLFYTNLASGQNIHKAFSNAQNNMKEKYPPYYWAGFVVIN